MWDHTCPYCQSEAVLVDGLRLYPENEALATRLFWKCPNCDAQVGCHPGTTKPLGTLANAELRALRAETHKLFDQLWITETFSRTEAYAWLGQHMQIHPAHCHIGMFTMEQCNMVIEIMAKYSPLKYTPKPTGFLNFSM